MALVRLFNLDFLIHKKRVTNIQFTESLKPSELACPVPENSSVPSLSSAIKLGENISAIWDELRELAAVIQVLVGQCGPHVIQGMGNLQEVQRTRVHLKPISEPEPLATSQPLQLWGHPFRL